MRRQSRRALERLGEGRARKPQLVCERGQPVVLAGMLGHPPGELHEALRCLGRQHPRRLDDGDQQVERGRLHFRAARGGNRLLVVGRKQRLERRPHTGGRLEQPLGQMRQGASEPFAFAGREAEDAPPGLGRTEQDAVKQKPLRIVPHAVRLRGRRDEDAVGQERIGSLRRLEDEVAAHAEVDLHALGVDVEVRPRMDHVEVAQAQHGDVGEAVLAQVEDAPSGTVLIGDGVGNHGEGQYTITSGAFVPARRGCKRNERNAT